MMDLPSFSILVYVQSLLNIFKNRSLSHHLQVRLNSWFVPHHLPTSLPPRRCQRRGQNVSGVLQWGGVSGGWPNASWGQVSPLLCYYSHFCSGHRSFIGMVIWSRAEAIKTKSYIAIRITWYLWSIYIMTYYSSFNKNYLCIRPYDCFLIIMWTIEWFFFSSDSVK